MFRRLQNNVTNFVLNSKNKPEITVVMEFVFHYAINSSAYLKIQFTFVR